jgi:hypothetical protein
VCHASVGARNYRRNKQTCYAMHRIGPSLWWLACHKPCLACSQSISDWYTAGFHEVALPVVVQACFNSCQLPMPLAKGRWQRVVCTPLAISPPNSFKSIDLTTQLLCEGFVKSPFEKYDVTYRSLWNLEDLGEFIISMSYEWNPCETNAGPNGLLCPNFFEDDIWICVAPLPNYIILGYLCTFIFYTMKSL